ncbi:MAG: ABC transporter ATP-binding protein [Kiritimatiellae bacterium]|nr:ABC transporter ATP-binding protein [Kiritimatiellia bacterium]
MSQAKLLEVSHLRIAFRRDGRQVVPVRDVSFSVPEHGRVALVGESGCGKSLTALSLAGLPPIDRAEVGGSISFTPIEGRSPRLAYVFQNPTESLNPVMRVRDQIREALPDGLSRRAGDDRIVELLARTGLPDPVRAASSFPCELSGGQQQRAMIAMALAAQPDLLVADEPTTALDVTTQREVLDLMDSLAAETGMAVLLITHNLGLVAGRMDTVNVMYAGTVVESGPVVEVLADPRHPYTQGLLAAVPALDAPRDAPLADIPGTVPPPDAWPPGCAFAPRCSLATDRCRSEIPAETRCGARSLACLLRQV